MKPENQLLIYVSLFIIIVLSFLIVETYRDQQQTLKEVCYKAPSNLTYSYFNKNTLEVTYEDSKIPMYVRCYNE